MTHSNKHIEEDEGLFFENAYFPAIASLLFSAIFIASYTHNLPAVLASGQVTEQEVSLAFQNYGVMIGLGFGGVSLVGMYIAYFLLWTVRLSGSRPIKPLILLAGYGFWLWFAIAIVYFEKRNTDIAKAVIDYLGMPLLHASAAIVFLSIVWLVSTFFVRVKGVHHG